MQEVHQFINKTIDWMELENEEPENTQIQRFVSNFTKEANSLLNSWFRIENLEKEHEKWLKILDNG